MDKTIEEIGDIVVEYNNTEITDGAKLNEQLKQLTTKLFYIETHRAKAHEYFEFIINENVKEGTSVARATNEANIRVPEMYKLRRLLESGYRVVDAMRTNISFLKTEMSNIAKNY